MRTSRKLLFVAVVFFVVFIGVEIVLRLTTSQVGRATIPDEQVLHHVENGGMGYDPVLGWVRIDGPSKEHGIDENSFRYAEPLSKEKPEGTFRAFSIGDSQTYGAGVNQPHTYTAYAEAALREQGHTVELINAGLSGYHSLQALRLIKVKLMDWDPDLLIVDCPTFDSPRDDLLPPRDQFPVVEQMLFKWRTYYVLRLLVEEMKTSRSRPMRAEGMDIPEAELRIHFGNHDLIADYVHSQGREIVFLDYPFWGTEVNDVMCMAPAEELPRNAIVAPVCNALQTAEVPPSKLFLDNNHLSNAGNKIVGETLAATIAESFLQ